MHDDDRDLLIRFNVRHLARFYFDVLREPKRVTVGRFTFQVVLTRRNRQSDTEPVRCLYDRSRTGRSLLENVELLDLRHTTSRQRIYRDCAEQHIRIYPDACLICDRETLHERKCATARTLHQDVVIAGVNQRGAVRFKRISNRIVSAARRSRVDDMCFADSRSVLMQ